MFSIKFNKPIKKGYFHLYKKLGNNFVANAIYTEFIYLKKYMVGSIKLP